MTGSAVVRADFANSTMSGTSAIDTSPRNLVSVTRTLTAGIAYLVGFIPINSFTVNNAICYIRTAATSASLSVAICTVSGTTATVVAVSDVLVTSTAGTKTLSFTTAGAQRLNAGTQYAVAILAASGGGAPGVLGSSGAGSDIYAASLANLDPMIYTQSSTTTYATLPSAGNTIASNTSTGLLSFPFIRLT